MEASKHELKMALTQRAKKLKSETKASAGGVATETAEIEVRADDALADAHPTLIQVDAESIATEHASAEFGSEVAMAEILHRMHNTPSPLGPRERERESFIYRRPGRGRYGF